jgi:hypothetical protein
VKEHASIVNPALMALIFVGSASAQTTIPACPSGTQVQKSASKGRPYIEDSCKLPEKRDGIEMCAEATDTAWNTAWPVPCGSRTGSHVSYSGPLTCPISQQVYLGPMLKTSIQCLPPDWTTIPLNRNGCPAGSVQGSYAVFPDDVCFSPKPLTQPHDLSAHDINGFTLGMSVKEVEEHAGHPLQSRGGGDFAVSVEGIDYDFGFSVLGHLCRIDSKQPLGRFIPDAAFGKTLTEKLAAKYGPSQHNQLPDGPASWEFLEPYQIGPGLTGNRATLSLSAMLMSGYNQPVSLSLKLMDFRIMRHDAAIANSDPRSRAERATRF